MINEPVALAVDSFQDAWLAAVRHLIQSQWEARNLVVQVRNPCAIDLPLHERISVFASNEGLLTPKHVAYTIFPHGLYTRKGNAAALFHAYNRPNGLYDSAYRRTRRWGTYFRRMTHYQTTGGPVNQLGNIIDAVRSRRGVWKAAFTIIIQNPGSETTMPRGGPCLNYIAVQAEACKPPFIGLLAVYRNHDFLERAYGNYWGLCNLLCFLAKETGANPGPLTCVSSRAYVETKRTALKALVEAL